MIGRWDAAYVLALAIPLNVAIPMAVLFIYVGKVNYPDSKMWSGGSWWPNSHHGRLLLLAKYCGVAATTVGVLKATQLHRKVVQKWRELRRGAQVDSAGEKA